MIDQYKKLSYEERLSRLNLVTLETRRLRGDLIEVFKILKGFDNVNYVDILVSSSSNLRGHSLKLFKARFVSDIGKYSFGNRIVDEWNLLNEEIVSCNTVEQFKNKLDRHLRCCRGFI